MQGADDRRDASFALPLAVSLPTFHSLRAADADTGRSDLLSALSSSFAACIVTAVTASGSKLQLEASVARHAASAPARPIREGATAACDANRTRSRSELELELVFTRVRPPTSIQSSDEAFYDSTLVAEFEAGDRSELEPRACAKAENSGRQKY